MIDGAGDKADIEDSELSISSSGGNRADKFSCSIVGNWSTEECSLLSPISGKLLLVSLCFMKGAR